MEALTSGVTFENEERALKSLLNRFGFVLSLEVIRSTFCKAGRDADLAGELLSELQTDPSDDIPQLSNSSVKKGTLKVSDDSGFIKRCYANGNCDEKASRLEKNFVSRGTLGKEHVWRVSNRSVNSETVSKSSNDNDFSRCENRNCDEKQLESRRTFVSRGTFGKEYVWRARAGQDANVSCDVSSGTLNSRLASISQVSDGSVKSETSSRSFDDNNFIWPSYANRNSDEKVLRSQINLVSRGTTRKECVWRAKLVQDVPNNCVPKPGDDNVFNSNSPYANGNDNSKVSKLEKVSDSTVVVSSVHAEDYVRHVREENARLSDSSVNVDTNSRKSCDDNAFNSIANGNDDIESNLEKVHGSTVVPSQAWYVKNNGNTQLRLKNNSASVDRVSSFPGKDYVWRPKVQDANLTSEENSSNGEVKSETSNSTDNSDYGKSCFASVSDDSQASGLTKRLVFTGSTSGVVGKDYVWRVRKNGTPNGENISKEEVNNTLPSMHSSEESFSRRDADSCVKKDFEDFLLDTLGRGLHLQKSAIHDVLGNCGYDMKKSLETVLDLAARTLDRRNSFHKGINFNSNLTQNEERKQKLPERTTRYSRILSGPPNEKSKIIESMVSEPRENIVENHNGKATSYEAKEDSYQILRKTVQKYRDTAKEYYKAAVEAYASGNRAQSSVLLEKGQSFSNMAREADEQSAEKIFEIRDGETQDDDMCLDLQHHDAKEAVRLVKCHLRSLPGNSFNNLKIVVGIGLEDVEKRKRLVIKLLEREAIEWVEDEKAGTIAIRLDKINPKCLSFARR